MKKTFSNIQDINKLKKMTVEKEYKNGNSWGLQRIKEREWEEKIQQIEEILEIARKKKEWNKPKNKQVIIQRREKMGSINGLIEQYKNRKEKIVRRKLSGEKGE